jgi:hypothetical protein
MTRSLVARPRFEGGKKCEHDCCVKTAKEGKVCDKCHPKKDEKK